MKKSKFISVLDVEKELCIWYMMLIQNLNKNNIFNIRNKNKSKTKTTQFSYLPRHYSHYSANICDMPRPAAEAVTEP